jgi:hypothetical protein
MIQKQGRSDSVLKQLVNERREAIAGLVASRAEQRKDLETRGKSQLAALRKTLPKDMVTVFDKLEAMHAGTGAASKGQPAQFKFARSAAAASGEHTRLADPGIGPDKVRPPRPAGAELPPDVPFLPYYEILYNPDGSVAAESEILFNIDSGFSAGGGSLGLFGTGAGDGTVTVDWWFRYNVPNDGNYNHTIYVPTPGNYSLYADDGFWTSKEAHASINLAAQGWQFNYKNTGNSNVMDVDSQNINVKNVPLPTWSSFSYSDLLVAGEAHLRVSAAYYLYARGDGSSAEFNLVNADIFVYAPYLVVAV